MSVSNKRLLALADRIERVQSYSAIDLGADVLRGVDQKKASKKTKVILIAERNRALLANALRNLAS